MLRQQISSDITYAITKPDVERKATEFQLDYWYVVTTITCPHNYCSLQQSSFAVLTQLLTFAEYECFNSDLTGPNYLVILANFSCHNED